LLGACLTVATFTHWTPFSSSVESLYLDQIAVRMTMGAPSRSNKVPERQFYMSALGTKQKCYPVRHMSAIEG
jgi:hypothetical protein